MGIPHTLRIKRGRREEEWRVRMLTMAYLSNRIVSRRKGQPAVAKRNRKKITYTCRERERERERERYRE
jgi:hypothetical protein